MQIGTQLVAPAGLGPLEHNCTYSFLRSDSARERVHVVRFDTKPMPNAVLLVVDQARFEEGLLAGAIAAAPAQRSLPPWLEGYSGIDLELIDSCRTGAAMSHSDRVVARLKVINPLVKRFDEVITDDDPIREINRFARSCSPRQNERRIRLWLFSYLCFGQSVWALMPPFCAIGRSSPDRCVPGNKPGRPSLRRGSGHGFLSKSMSNKITKSYRRFCGFGESMSKIYRRAMSEEFGCIVVTDKFGRPTYMHPKGEPWPTYEQFRYRVMLALGAEDVQKTLYGEARYRSQLSSHRGRFSESKSNLMEGMEVDVFQVIDVPRGLLSDRELPPLYAAKFICGTSGMITGIGLTFGAERAEAYQMAMFCQVISKAAFGRLFGVDISDEDWPCVGLPLATTSDRGPGFAERVVESWGHSVGIREMVGSYAAQSKGTVESSHPRNIKGQGQPTYVQSRLNPIQLVRREIIRVVSDNKARDASSRLTPAMVAAGVAANPLAIWKHLEARGRTCACPMAFEDAVRAFLPARTIELRRDGIYLHGLRYNSPALLATGQLERVARHGSAQVVGYVLPLSARFIWVEIAGRLIEVGAQLPIRDDNEQLYLSLVELESFGRELSTLRAEQRHQAHAVHTQAFEQFRQEVGMNWHAGSRKAGRAKRATARAEREARDIVSMTTKE